MKKWYNSLSPGEQFGAVVGGTVGALIFLFAMCGFVGVLADSDGTNVSHVGASTSASASESPTASSPSASSKSPSPEPSTSSEKPSPKPSKSESPSPPPKPDLCGAPQNPYGYNYCGTGGVVHDPPGDICFYFECIDYFDEGKGYMVACDDGMVSMSGGRSGACSYHGGVGRTVYGG
ncbi:hypothetical protein [Stackebrandtia nassauensis]|uniref:Uncharacterized protein n=1 Tax=Stackebrandtia nassauensis (strain DSM 44728 / CIP 108903 / NRRL B-16338 / NBRC 102104 / LLR-40K-21) TaxID=446470 RepID=D3Q4D9_STANL|nr:hypothetical protein [Stackebrandtia nassauensis]ADD40099.1 hypothetical protein Snas_0382 [Stackebrandtia nassauensis DSM 44728]